MKRPFIAVLTLATGCGSSSTEPQVASSIRLTPSEVVVKRDSTRAFIGTVLDQHGLAITGMPLTYTIRRHGYCEVRSSAGTYPGRRQYRRRQSRPYHAHRD